MISEHEQYIPSSPDNQQLMVSIENIVLSSYNDLSEDWPVYKVWLVTMLDHAILSFDLYLKFN